MIRRPRRSTLFPSPTLFRSVPQRRVDLPERVDPGEELVHAPRIRLLDLLKRFPAKPGSRERGTDLLDRREGFDRPSGFREPADELDSFATPGELLTDEDRGAATQDATDLRRRSVQVGNVMDHHRDPDAVG